MPNNADTMQNISSLVLCLLRKAGSVAECGVLLSVCLCFAVGAVAQTDDRSWGVIDVSVCNLRNAADYDAGMSTQALLGMPVKVSGENDWLHVVTPDGYEAWVHPSSVWRMTRAQLVAWNQRPKVNVTAFYGFVYSAPNERSSHVGDVVASNRLALLGSSRSYWHVAYPDGRTGYLPKRAAQELTMFRRQVSLSAASLLATALSFNGIPYMWGGTSTKGVDCSGFVSSVMLMHDVVIARNARQQALIGEHIEIAPDFSNLRPGDLVFFGSKPHDNEPAHVHHVGIYIGKGRFIHSLGWVHVSSLLPSDPLYDAYNRHRLLWAQRVLPYVNKTAALRTTELLPFYGRHPEQ